jgi:hypothetical protein
METIAFFKDILYFLPSPLVRHPFSNCQHDFHAWDDTHRVRHESSLSYYYLSWSPREDLACSPRYHFRADFLRHRRTKMAEWLMELSMPGDWGED